MNNFSLRIVHKKNLRQEDNKNIRTEFKYGISVFKCIILLLSNGNCGITCREIKWDVEKNLVFFQYLDGHWKKGMKSSQYAVIVAQWHFHLLKFLLNFRMIFYHRKCLQRTF